MPIEDKNQHSYFPISHNDIVNEVPIDAQRLQDLAFTSWLGIVLCLVFNIIAVTDYWIKGRGTKIFLLVIIYVLVGCHLSYVLWYRSLYRAMRMNSAMNFGWFFLVYTIHICFCIVFTIAPPIVFEGKSLMGNLAAIDLFSNHVLVGDLITYQIRHRLHP